MIDNLAATFAAFSLGVAIGALLVARYAGKSYRRGWNDRDRQRPLDLFRPGEPIGEFTHYPFNED